MVRHKLKSENFAFRLVRNYTKRGAIGFAFVVATAALSFSMWNSNVKAVTPPDSCFAFSSGTITDYYDNENDDSEQPACPNDVDVPSTIGGVTVTTLGPNSFANSGVTAIRLPNTITDIQYYAFEGLTLSEVYINVGGNLNLNGSFTNSNISASDLNISAAGDLLVNGTLSGINITGTMTLSAGGNLTVTNGSASGLVVGALDIDAGGDVTISNASFASSNLGSEVSIDAVGNVLVNNSGFTGANTGALAVSAGGTLTFYAGGSFNTISSGVTLNSTGNISLSSGTLSGSGIGGNLNVNSGGTIQFNLGAVGVNSFSEATIAATTGISLINGSLATSPNMTDLEITTQTGLVELSGILNSSNILGNLSVTAPEGLLVANGAFSEFSAAVDLTLGGDITIKSGTFSSIDVDSFDLITDGSIVIESGAFATNFSGFSRIRHINWRAGNDLTLGSGLLATYPNTRDIEDITLHAGNALVVENGAFSEAYSLESLSLQAGGSAAIGGSTFGYNKLSNLSLPSSTVSIGNNAFSYGTIDAVYLNGGTPTIGQGAFKFSGISSDATTGFSNIDQVHYVQLYTDADSLNPGGYTDTVYTQEYIDSDDVPDLSGGYIVNPATYIIDYRTNNGSTLRSSFISGTGLMLSNYLASANQTGDLSLYYRANDNIALTAQDIDGYITPDSHSLILASGVNEYTFIYNPIVATSDNTDLDTPNTGLLSFIGNIKSAIWASTTLALLAGLTIVMKKITLKRR